MAKGISGRTTGAEAFKDLLIDGKSPIVAQEVTFTETTGAGVYTGSVAIPAGATILNIRVRNTVLWTATTSATLKVGDDDDDDGFFTAVDMKATDLVVGEELNFDNLGGKQGVYLVAATGHRDAYRAAAKTVKGIITTVGAAGNAGRSRMIVEYVLPTKSALAATKV